MLCHLLEMFLYANFACRDLWDARKRMFFTMGVEI